jgi:glycine/sarcosine N-methyltransferase
MGINVSLTMDDDDALSKFYSGFTEKYDIFLPWDKRMSREKHFFRQLLRENEITVLDCFSGTGFHVAMLREMGFEANGIDISGAMIAKARQNLSERGIRADILECDVKQAASTLDKRFDCVLSMGNSLPHLFGDDNLLEALRNMHGLLNSGGTCVIHIENYDLLYEDHDRFIPSVYRRTEEGTDSFIFAIDYHEDRVIFNILSIIERNYVPKFSVDVVEYNPLWTDKLNWLMKKAGFEDIKFYEDFRMTPLGKGRTYDLIAVARSQRAGSHH